MTEGVRLHNRSAPPAHGGGVRGRRNHLRVHKKVDSETMFLVMQENAAGVPVLTPSGAGRVPWGASVNRNDRICVLLDKKRGIFGYRGTMVAIEDVHPMSN